MDWFSVVLIFLFVVLPIIQQVIEAAKKKEEPEAGTDPLEAGEPMPRLEADGRRDQAKESAWSDDWVPWPSEELEDAELEDASREVVTLERTLPAAPEVRRAVVDRLAQHTALVAKRREAPPIKVRPAAVRPRPKRLSGIRTSLERPDDVRRALVLSEILAPPVSMRSGEPGSRGD